MHVMMEQEVKEESVWLTTAVGLPFIRLHGPSFNADDVSIRVGGASGGVSSKPRAAAATSRVRCTGLYLLVLRPPLSTAHAAVEDFGIAAFLLFRRSSQGTPKYWNI